MSRCVVSLSLFLALVGCSAPVTGPADQAKEPEQASTRISYMALTAGEELRVRLHAYGCFHDVVVTFIFQPAGQGSARVLSETHRKQWLGPALVSARDTLIGTWELASLEQELANYREPSQDTCTSQSDLELELYRAGALVRRERYHQGTCRFFEGGPRVTLTSLTLPR